MSMTLAFALIAVAITAAIELLLMASLLGGATMAGLLP